MLQRARAIVTAAVLPMACVTEPEARDELGAAFEPGEGLGGDEADEAPADGGTLDHGDEVDEAPADGGTLDHGGDEPGDPVAITGPGSVCSTGYGWLDCNASSTTLTVDGTAREVLWALPAGTPPAGGWPVVLAFHGTNDPASKLFSWSSWSAIDVAYGGYYQTKTVQALLDAGFAVLAPAARLRAGGVYWDTNVAPYAFDWGSAPDGALVEALFDAIEAGTFGPLDADRKYAMGLSSGGYMASRLAVSYPGEVRAIALQSASYATCISSLPCPVTAADLPEEHAATLLMAGYWDAIVPLYTIDDYAAALDDNGTPVELHVVGNAAHQWTSWSPGWVLAWFQAY